MHPRYPGSRISPASRRLDGGAPPLLLRKGGENQTTEGALAAESRPHRRRLRVRAADSDHLDYSAQPCRR